MPQMGLTKLKQGIQNYLCFEVYEKQKTFSLILLLFLWNGNVS